MTVEHENFFRVRFVQHSCMKEFLKNEKQSSFFPRKSDNSFLFAVHYD